MDFQPSVEKFPDISLWARGSESDLLHFAAASNASSRESSSCLLLQRCREQLVKSFLWAEPCTCPPSVSSNRFTLSRCRWGNDDDVARVRSLGGPDGYDVIIGADVVYVKEAVPLLFQSAAALLARTKAPPPADVMLTPPVLLLCHVIRRVAESEILEAARRAGFEHHRSIPFVDGDGTLANSGAIRLLALWRTAGSCSIE